MSDYSASNIHIVLKGSRGCSGRDLECICGDTSEKAASPPHL